MEPEHHQLCFAGQPSRVFMLCHDMATVHSFQQFVYVIGKLGDDCQFVNDQQPVPQNESNTVSVHVQTPKRSHVNETSAKRRQRRERADARIYSRLVKKKKHRWLQRTILTIINWRPS